MLDGSQVQRVCDVPIDHIHFIWPQARGFIGRALERGAGGRFLVSDILSLLLAGKARLWVSWDGEKVEGAIVTETIDFPQLREVRVWLVGGDNLRAWFDEAADMIEAFARDQGASVIASGGRKGWLRLLSDRGYGATGPNFEKRLV